MRFICFHMAFFGSRRTWSPSFATSIIPACNDSLQPHAEPKGLRNKFRFLLAEDRFWSLTDRMLKETLAEYLMLDVSRADPLQDALNQLWGLQRRQLLKPLKIRMGHQEGEVGVDLGGVSLEFFRIVLSQVFNPDNGVHICLAGRPS